MPTLIIIIIGVALLFDFMNGRNDAANSIATVVSTRVLTPFLGVLWAAFWNFAALFIFGVHVAKTVGTGIIESSAINEYVILTALVSAIIWVFTCQRYGLPNSVSHALIGGLIGPALLVGGTSALVASGIIKVAVFIVIAPVFGAVLGFLVMSATMWVFRKTPPRKVDAGFRVMQLVSSAVFSLGHGSNDA
jgi:PiT family inorganic phosphate transporter